MFSIYKTFISIFFPHSSMNTKMVSKKIRPGIVFEKSVAILFELHLKIAYHLFITVVH